MLSSKLAFEIAEKARDIFREGSLNEKVTIKILPGQGKNVNWVNGTLIVISHVASIIALFCWSWPAVISAIILCLDRRQSGHRDGLSSLDYTSRLRSPNS
jgi:hypothetical protein